MFKCQLSDSDRFVGVANFTEDKDFSYCGVQVDWSNHFRKFLSLGYI